MIYKKMKRPNVPLPASVSAEISNSRHKKVHQLSDLSEDEHPTTKGTNGNHHGDQTVLDTDTEIHAIVNKINQKAMASNSKRKRRSGEDLDPEMESPRRKKSKSSVSDLSDSSFGVQSPLHVPANLPQINEGHSDNSSPSKKKKHSKHKRQSVDSTVMPSTSSAVQETKCRASLNEPEKEPFPRVKRKAGAQKSTTLRQTRALPYNAGDEVTPKNSSVYVEQLNMKHIKLFLCQVPAKMDVDVLQDREYKPGHLFKYKTDQESKTKMEIQVSKFSSSKAADCMTCVTHSKSSGKLEVVHNPFSGIMTISERVSVPPTPLPTVTPKPPRELPPGLKQRHVPFGADHPLHPTKKKHSSREEEPITVKKEEPQDSYDGNNDNDTNVSSSAKKKKKKKKKKKIKEEEVD